MEERSSIQLGRMGEKHFDSIGTDAGLTINSSDPDMKGWDLFVEFGHRETMPQTPIDLRPQEMECKVQVKSAERCRGGVYIKLSNMERMCKSLTPQFICRYVYDRQEKPIRGYIIPIDDQLVFKTLKKLRENEALHEPKALHEIEIWVGYNESHRLEDPKCGKELKRKLLSYIPNGMTEYSDARKQLLSKTGYEEIGRKQFSINYRCEDPHGQLVDFLLGIVPIDVESGEHFDNRFGIPLREEHEIGSLEGASLEATGSENEIYIELCAGKFKPGKRFLGQAFTVPEELIHPEKPVLRWVSDFLEFLFYENGKFSIGVPFSEESVIPIADLERFLNACYDCSASEDSIIKINLGPLKHVSIPLKAIEFTGLISRRDLVVRCRSILEQLQIDVSTLKVSLNSILGNSQSIDFLEGCLANPSLQSPSAILSKDPGGLDGQKTAILNPIFLPFSESQIVAWGAITGTWVCSSTQKVSLEKTIWCQGPTFEFGLKESSDVINQSMSSFVEDLKCEGYMVLQSIGDNKYRSIPDFESGEVS